MKMWSKRYVKRFLLIIMITIFTIVHKLKSDDSFETNDSKQSLIIMRKLLSQSNKNQFNYSAKSVDPINCTTPAIENFPSIPRSIRGSIAMSLFACLIIIYFFIGTALICDQYFVPSLEVICHKLHLGLELVFYLRYLE